MELKESFIILSNLRFHAFHGVLPQERVTGNDYVVSLKMGYDFSKAMGSDRVEDTLNYASVFEVVRREMAVPCNLLERVAGRIGSQLFRSFPTIVSLHLSITKVNPPMGSDSDGAGVEVHLINDKT